MAGGRRAGIALLATIAAISLVGILALASARLARGRMIGVRRITAVHEVSRAAARLLDSATASSRAGDWALVPIGTQVMLRDVPGLERLLLHRASETLFRLDVALQRGDAAASVRHAASLLVRADMPRLDRGAPLVVGAVARVASDFQLSAGPVHVACTRSAAIVDAIAADTTLLTWENASAAARVLEDPALRSASAFDLDATRLRAAAQLTLAPGAHWSPATDTPALVAALGDLTLGPGQGRGALLVIGRLTIVGPLEFTGSILALGGVTTSGPDIELTGTLMTAGEAHLSGGSLRHDACAARDASMRAARLIPLREWSYATLP